MHLKLSHLLNMREKFRKWINIIKNILLKKQSLSIFMYVNLLLVLVSFLIKKQKLLNLIHQTFSLIIYKISQRYR